VNVLEREQVGQLSNLLQEWTRFFFNEVLAFSLNEGIELDITKSRDLSEVMQRASLPVQLSLVVPVFFVCYAC